MEYTTNRASLSSGSCRSVFGIRLLPPSPHCGAQPSRLTKNTYPQDHLNIDAGFLATRCLDANQQLGASIIPHRVLFPGSTRQEPPTPAWWPDATLKLSKRIQGALLRDKLALGTLLVAHPLLLQSTLTRGLVLVCEHGRDGDVGLVLNRPTGVTLRQGLEQRAEGHSKQVEEVLEVFGDNLLWRGGDVGEKLGVLHPHGQLRRAKEVAQGLYWQCDLSQAPAL